MIKKKGLVLIPILTLIFSFGFIAQPTNADTSTTTTTEGTAQTTDQTATTEDTTQTTDQTVNNTKSTTQSTDQTKQTTQTAVQSTDEVVTFKDANLAQAIRDQLGLSKGDNITKSELLKLTDLVIYQNKNITDLSGLEYAKNLVNLTIYDNQVKDLSPLSSLVKLQVLVLFGNQISDLSPLSHLTNLTILTLGENQIRDISPLGSLTKLQLLDLTENHITDLTPLGKLTQLQTLTLANNQVSNIDVLTKLKKLMNLDVEKNPLNLNQGSSAYQTLQTIIGRDGVVIDDAVLEIKTKKVTSDSIKVKWDVSQKYLSYGSGRFEITLSVNGKDVKVFTDLKKTEYTFTGLEKGKVYKIGIVLHSGLKQRDNFITKTINVKAEDVKPMQQAVVKPTMGGHNATISYGNINLVKPNGTLVIDLKNNKQDQLNVQLTAEQIKMLQDKKVDVKINKGDTTVSIPTQLLGSGKDVTVAVDKLNPVQGALSAAYDFTIKTAGGTISKFKQPVTMTFTVDPSKVKNPDNVKVWYYNPSTKKWELIGGTYANGVVTAQTYHFSTYAVFEKDQKTSSNASDKSAKSGTGSSADSSSGQTDELPNTATNTMNFMALGALLVLLASVFLWFQRRKQKA